MILGISPYRLFDFCIRRPVPTPSDSSRNLRDAPTRRQVLFAGATGVAALAAAGSPSLTLFADELISPVPKTQSTRQAISREKITKLALDSLKKLNALSPLDRTKESARIEWNNLITFFAISEEVDLPGSDSIREYVLRNGSSDRSIPLDVVDAAISTVHDWANLIQGDDVEARRMSVYELLKPYAGNCVVDLPGNTRGLRRIPPIDENVELKDVIFPAHSSYAISSVITQEEINKLALNSDTQQIFVLYSKNNKLPEQVISTIEKQVSSNLDFNSIHNSSPENNLFCANNLLMLALNSRRESLALCKRWFDTKNEGERSSYGDLAVLRAVAVLAQNDSSAQDYLEEVGRKFPGMFFREAYLSAHESEFDGYNTEAGDEITAVLNSSPKRTKSFLKEIVQDSTQDKTGPILGLGTMNDSEDSAEILRAVLQDSKYSDIEKVSAMAGLAYQRDKESIPLLLEIACKAAFDRKLREKALLAIVLIDTKDPIPQRVRQKYAEESPCGLDFSIVSDFLLRDNISDPFITGTATRGVSIMDSVSGIVKNFTYRTSYSNGYLENLREQNQELLNKLVDIYLRSNQESLDLPVAILAMKILSNSKYKDSIPDLCKMSEDPDNFVQNTPKNNVITELLSSGSKKEPAANSIILRDFATLFLGEVADPNVDSDDAAFGSLYTMALEEDPLLRPRAYQAINIMASHNNGKRSPHLDKVIKLTRSFIDEQYDSYVSRRGEFREDFHNLFLLLDSTCKLGGLKEVFDLSQDNPKLKRLVANVFKLNNIGSADLSRLGIANADVEDLFSLLPNNSNRNDKQVRVAMIDGGPVMYSDDSVQEEISTPAAFTSSLLLETQFSAHANTVGGLIGGEITSYPYITNTRLTQLKPKFLQDAGYRSMLHILANNLTEGNVPFDILSQSWGMKTIHLTTPDGRKYVDIANSAFTFLNEAGVLCLNTTGNDRGSHPRNLYGDLGSYSQLGLRVRGRNNYELPSNVLYVNVGNPFEINGTPAPFGGQLAPKRKLNLPTIIHDGTTPVTWYSGRIVETATSYALPLFVHELASILADRREQGLPDLSPNTIINLLTNGSEEAIVFDPRVAESILLSNTLVQATP